MIRQAGESVHEQAAGFVSDIQGKKFSANTFRHGTSICLIAIGQPHDGLSMSERFGNRSTDARGRPSDERHFVFETKHHKSFLR